MFEAYEGQQGHIERRGFRADRLRARIAVIAVACGLAASSSSAQTGADPVKFRLPSAAYERLSGRTETSKEFALPGGTSARILFTHPIHYQDASGQWQDVDLSFHDDGQGGQIMDRHAKMRVHVPGRSPVIEITDTAGNGVRWLTAGAMSTHGRRTQYADAQGITWTYTTTPSGVKHQATVTALRGPHTYRFGYQLLGNQPSFTIDATGNAVAGNLEVPRPTVSDAQGMVHPAGPWRVRRHVLTFDFDDTGVSTPYTIDPTTRELHAEDVSDWAGTSYADTW